MIPLGFWSLKIEPGKTFTQAIGDRHVLHLTNVAYDETVSGDERSIVKMRYPEFSNGDDDLDAFGESDDEDMDEDDEDDEDSESNSEGDDDDEDEDEEMDAEDDEDDEEDFDEEEQGDFTEKIIPLASLKPNVTEQACLNVTLPPSIEIVEFFVTGSNPVYLSGTFEAPAEVLGEESDEEDEDDEDEFDEDDDDESIPSDFDSEIDSDVDVESDEDESDESASAEEDPSRFETIDEVPEAKSNKKEDAKAKKIEEKPKAAATEEPDLSGLSKNQRKKRLRELRQQADAKQEAEAAAPPAKKQNTTAAPASNNNKIQNKGGLIIEEVKAGSGAPVKRGDKVAVRYIGKLNNASGKIFDQNTNGKPLMFRAGTGEVISGWDQGILGMTEGSERRLTIPANLAYGKRGAPPTIPPNATLYFEVKLLKIK